MDLYLVRHAESLSNVGLVKDHDSDLSPKGIQQAEHLAEHLKNVRFDRIYASHLTRTVRTAAIIAQKQEGCPLITVDPNLSERGTDINYPARVELHKTIYPNLAYTKTSIGTDYHGDAERAEHPLQEYVFSPAYNEATEVTEKNGTEIRTNPQKILIVAHGAMNAVILSRLVNFRFDVNMNVCQHNTCVNRFRFFLHDGVQRTAFISYNDITHLPPDLRKEY